jgi:hypothetical protein
LTTLRANELVNEPYSSAQLGREQVPVATLDQRAAVRVTDTLRDELRSSPPATVPAV